jgi:hypothetical protein
MRQLAEDMARWEAGGLPLVEVQARHPDAGVGGLAKLHDQLSSVLGEDPPLEAAGIWMTIRPLLQERPVPWGDRVRRKVVRPLVAAAAAAFLLAGIAFAAGVEPVRQSVDTVVRVVKEVFDGDRREVSPPSKAPDADGDRQGPRSSGTGDDRGGQNDDRDRSSPNRGSEQDDDGEGESNAGRDEDRAGPSGDPDQTDDESDEPDDELEEPDVDNSGPGSSSSGSGPSEERDGDWDDVEHEESDGGDD